MMNKDETNGTKKRPSSIGRGAEGSRDDTVPVDLAPLARQMRMAEEKGKGAYLLFLDGMDTGRVVVLDERPVVIGKDHNCDIVVDDDGVSRVHAKIQLVDRKKIIVQDLGSTNGTFIAGDKIEKAIAKPDEKILFGRRTMVQFVLWDALDQSYKQELFESCPRDGLTGVNNRKFLRKRLVADISYARRHRIPLMFMLIDIDDFNSVNCDYGLHTGDQILVTLSQLVAGMIRTEDVFGRHGSDEFAVLALGIGLDGAMKLAERVRSEVAKAAVRSLDDRGERVSITVAIGVAIIHEKAIVDSGEVIAVAGQNLSSAKRKGRSQIVASEIG